MLDNPARATVPPHAGADDRDQVIVPLRAITSIAVFISLPLVSAGTDGGRPFSLFCRGRRPEPVTKVLEQSS